MANKPNDGAPAGTKETTIAADRTATDSDAATSDAGAAGADDASKAKRSLPLPGSPTSRRGFLIGAVAGGLGLTVGKKLFFGGAPAEAGPVHNFTQDITEWSPSKALAALKRGNSRFVKMTAVDPNVNAERRTDVATGQHPFAAIVGCVDSRVTPELVFDRGIGDLFVARVAGNIADDTIIGSIEFGVDEFDIPLLVVLGHTSCGAVTAAMEAAGHDLGAETVGAATDDPHAPTDDAHAVADDTHAPTDDAHAVADDTHAPTDDAHAVADDPHVVTDDAHSSDAEPADTGHDAAPVTAEAARAFATAAESSQIGSVVDALLPATEGANSVDDAVRINVQRTIEAFKSSPVLATRIEFGVLLVIGAIYDTATGVVEFEV